MTAADGVAVEKCEGGKRKEMRTHGETWRENERLMTTRLARDLFTRVSQVLTDT